MVSVIIVNWNGLVHLETCLSALSRQTYEPREIILVDNGSTDGSVGYVEANFPAVRLIRLSKNRGFCGGNNLGIQQSSGPFVALLNNDTEADPAWLGESVGALQAHPEAGFTATRMRLFSRRTHLDAAGDLYFRTGYPGKRGSLQPDCAAYDHSDWVFGASGGAVVYRRSMLEEIGLFDEDFFSFMEDIDLSFRAQLMGYRCLYVASAIVYHKVGGTAGRDDPRRQFWSHRNHWYTLIKNLPAPLWPRYLAQILTAEALVLGSTISRGRLGVFTRSRAEVLRQLPRMVEKRRAIQQRRQASINYVDSLIRKDWFSHRAAQKRREAEFLAAG